MRGRILRAIVGVTALAVVVLSVPLGLAVASVYRDEAVRRLVDDATQAATLVPAPLTAADPAELPSPEDGARLSLYAADGHRLSGPGPAAADPVTRMALGGHVGAASVGAEVVAAVPVGSQEQVVGAVRSALAQATVDGRVHRAWLILGGLGLAAVGLAAAVAVLQARRLSRPLDALGAAAVRLGGGDFSVQVPPSGVAEIDTVAGSLNATAARLAVVLERERAFSADASHQLRTPLTALRLRLEGGLLAGDGLAPAVAAALEEIDRLQGTVEELLELARDAPGDRRPLDLAALCAEQEGRWRAALAAVHRPLRLELPSALPPVPASASAMRQILDVLLDNAAVHGAGAVRVVAGELPGGVHVDVGDEGDGVLDPALVFARRASGGGGRGIGLALARSLAEAEGGRLLLQRAGPGPVFRLVLARRDPP
ncbi:MAG TPA: HAMP domain-containing sensor histidine kinase [Candidatus Dormibacteraeota bacterium]